MITIVSGGQTGADQGALRAAKEEGLPTEGWVPLGWKTDAGPAPWLADYNLRECRVAQYRVRTLLNVRRATALIWIGWETSPGGVLTLTEARRRGLPLLSIRFPEAITYDPCVAVRTFLAGLPLESRLMVAGNRERTNPGIEAYTATILGEGLIPF